MQVNSNLFRHHVNGFLLLQGKFYYIEHPHSPNILHTCHKHRTRNTVYPRFMIYTSKQGSTIQDRVELLDDVMTSQLLHVYAMFHCKSIEKFQILLLVQNLLEITEVFIVYNCIVAFQSVLSFVSTNNLLVYSRFMIRSVV